VTISGVGSTWTSDDVVVGGLGAGTLTVQNGGTVNSAAGGGSIGLSAGSTGTVTVTGPGSTWNNSPGGGLNIGSSGAGTLTIANGGVVINITAFAVNIGNRASSLGTVTVTGAGSTWTNGSGLNIGNFGTGTLTIADSAIVTAGPVVIATNAGSSGTLNIGAGPHGAERRIWRWNRYDQLQSHVHRLRVCASNQRRRHCQCACGLHHAHGGQQL
jgi:T5SS/PEP-CTERM-associated repeat protein